MAERGAEALLVAFAPPSPVAAPAVQFVAIQSAVRSLKPGRLFTDAQGLTSVGLEALEVLLDAPAHGLSGTEYSVKELTAAAEALTAARTSMDVLLEPLDDHVAGAVRSAMRGRARAARNRLSQLPLGRDELKAALALAADVRRQRDRKMRAIAALEFGLLDGIIRWSLDFTHLHRLHMRKALLRSELAVAHVYYEEKLTADALEAMAAPREVLSSWQPRHPDYQRARSALATAGPKMAESLRRSLQRWREAPRHEQGMWIRVNIPRFELEIYDGLSKLGTHRVVVGHPGRKAAPGRPGRTFKNRTPQLETTVSAVTVNPEWRVPTGILLREIDPEVARDPTWLKRRGFKIVMRSGRRRAIQVAGPGNALGRVKLTLPDGGGIYLHDTRQRFMFKWEKRAESHGCVRVDDALGLATRLLYAEKLVDRGRLRRLLRKWETRQFMLKQPVPIVLDYNTVVFDEADQPIVLADVYGWEAPDALESMPSLRYLARQRLARLRDEASRP